MEIQPRSAKLNLVLTQDAQVSNKDTGEVYDVAAAAARLPWVDFHWGGGRGMPRHQFVALGKAHDRAWDVLDDRAWDVLDFVIRKHPASYRAYFRGYPYPMRYWELGNWRYWHLMAGVRMLNRCTLDSVEPPRRVDDGAKPICWQEWGAPEQYEQGSGWPEEEKESYPARFKGQPFPACRHGAITEGDRVSHLASGRTGVVHKVYPDTDPAERTRSVDVSWDNGQRTLVGKSGLRTSCCVGERKVQPPRP